MASKKDLLSRLTRAELIAFVSEAGIEVADRRVREQLIAALSASRRARASEFLTSFSVDRLKQLAESAGSRGGGRNKAALIEAITSGTSSAGALSAAPARTRQRRTPAATSAAPLRVTKRQRTQTTKTKPRKA